MSADAGSGAPCFRKGVDPEGNPWCQLSDDHDGECRTTRSAGTDAGADEMGAPYLDRSVVLCRTCMRPLTWETRTEPGFKPRTGWYDDAHSDPLVCFKAVSYRHVPLTAREWAYYEAGQKSVTPPEEGQRSVST